MRSFKIKCLAFQLPYKIQELGRRMNLLEMDYPECKTIDEMDLKIHQEYVKRGEGHESQKDYEESNNLN